VTGNDLGRWQLQWAPQHKPGAADGPSPHQQKYSSTYSRLKRCLDTLRGSAPAAVAGHAPKPVPLRRTYALPRRCRRPDGVDAL